MGAKDTVIDLGETDNESLKVMMDKILLHQAKITWSIAEKAGMRKVVEFIEQWALRATYQADPSKECWGISDAELAELKEWGV